MSNIIRFIGVNKDTTTAGPGKRLEFFTKGCIRGTISPCDGCFNQSTWTFEGKFRPMSIEEVVEICEQDAWNRQVTFCGGEPILQGRALTQVAKRLKEIDPSFHFVMYCSYDLEVLMKSGLRFMWKKELHEEAMLYHLLDYCADARILEEDKNGNPTKVKIILLQPQDVRQLMKYIDLIVDGDFQIDKRLTTEKYMHEGWFIGSSNQRVFFGPETVQSQRSEYMYADEYNMYISSIHACKACGHEITGQNVFFNYCTHTCKLRYEKRQRELEKIGGIQDVFPS